MTLLTLWDADRFNSAREPLSAWTLKIVAQFTDGPLSARTCVAQFLLPTKLALSDLQPAEIAELVELVAAG
jgi:hypothetical protein